MGSVVRGLEFLSEAGGYVAGAVCVFLTALIAVAVISRRVFNAPLLITEEISGYMMLAIVFLGLAYTMKAEGHIRVDILLSSVPPGSRAVLETIATLLALGFAGLLFAEPGGWFPNSIRRGRSPSATFRRPSGFPGACSLSGLRSSAFSSWPNS